MRKIILLSIISSSCFAMLSDNMKNIWQPGFFVKPKVSSLSLRQELKAKGTESIDYFQYFFDDTVEGGYLDKTTDSTSQFNSKAQSMIAFGFDAGWNSLLFGQWFNSAAISFEMMKPNYGVQMAKFIGGSQGSGAQDTTADSTKAVMSMHIRAEDVVLHANHDWGSVLPYFGFGVEYYKVGGQLTYTEGSQTTTQIAYIPLGAYFQMNSSLAGQIQLNIPVVAKSKIAQQKATLKTAPATTEGGEVNTYDFSFADSTEFKHNIRNSLGYELSFKFKPRMLGADFSIEPYLQAWHLGMDDSTKDIRNLRRRWRSYGIRLALAL